MMDAELLAKLRCPETRQPVHLAEPGDVTKLNEAIRRGGATNRGGKPVSETIEGALVRQDRKVAYPIRHGIPLMLVEEALPLPV